LEAFWFIESLHSHSFSRNKPTHQSSIKRKLSRIFRCKRLNQR